jgi:RNA polymerase sigma-70 factor (ECF subfamily)
LVPILGIVIGEKFERLLAAAQGGTGEADGAFSVLWCDANPALLRYLRVIAPEAAEDIAADTWVQVVRGLGTFRGDEAAWRAWLFTTARRRAIDEGRRRSRRPVVSLPELPDETGPGSADPADLVLEKLSTEGAIAVISTLPRPGGGHPAPGGRRAGHPGRGTAGGPQPRGGPGSCPPGFTAAGRDPPGGWRHARLRGHRVTNPAPASFRRTA